MTGSLENHISKLHLQQGMSSSASSDLDTVLRAMSPTAADVPTTAMSSRTNLLLVSMILGISHAAAVPLLRAAHVLRLPSPSACSSMGWPRWKVPVRWIAHRLAPAQDFNAHEAEHLAGTNSPYARTSDNIHNNAVGLRQRDEVFDIDMPNMAGFLIKDGVLCRRRFIPIWQGKRSTWIGHEFIDDALGFSRNSIYDVI